MSESGLSYLCRVEIDKIEIQRSWSCFYGVRLKPLSGKALHDKQIVAKRKIIFKNSAKFEKPHSF